MLRCDGSSGHDRDMGLRTHYKARWIGKLPMCAICAGEGEGPRSEHFLTHGVSVWLCEGHRSAAFQCRRAGRDFVASLEAVWRAAGMMTRRRSAALTAHLARVRKGDQTRRRPGSYAWAQLRCEAEHRFGAGESPAGVIAEMLARPTTGATGPSYRTLRRWFSDARWLVAVIGPRIGPAPSATPAHPSPRPRPAGRGTGGPDPTLRGGPIRGPC